MRETTTATPAPPSTGGAGAAPAPAILEANLAAIARTSPRAARAIRDAPARTDVAFAPTHDGVLAGEAEGRALCSRRRPLEEARRLAEAVDLEKAGTVVVLGFALGHHVEALAARAKEVSAVVVFEPDASLLRAVLERIDHSRWITDSRVILVIDADDGPGLSQALRGLEAALAVGVEFAEHPPSRSRLAETAARFTQTFSRVFQSLRTHIVTTMVQTDVTVRNELMNVGHYASRPGVADLAGVAAGRPAIVVAAGPSLRRSIELLKTPGLRDRCVIICVQTVLRQLLAERIRPHFVTAIDYHEISRRFYENLDPADVADVTLVAEARANPAILDAYPGPIRVPHDAFLTRTLGWEDRPDRGAMIPAATVAHLSYYLARHLGADPVILVGQDLAFTDGQYYARGAAIHDVWAPELNPFNTLESMEWQRIVRARTTLHRASDHLGRPVYTDEQMATYLAQFERDFQADAERGLTIVDATEGGVAKAHTSIMPLAEAIRTHVAGTSELPPEPAARDEHPSDDDVEAVRARLRSVRADVRRIARASREARDLMRKMSRDQRDVARTNRLIDRVNAIRDEVQALDPAFELVMRLNQTGALKRFKADRAIRLARDLDPFERQRRQIERDAMNLEWIAEFADLLDRYLDAADRAFDGEPKLTRDLLPAPDDEPGPDGVRVERRTRVAGVIRIDEADLPGARRAFLGRPALWWTLSRLARCEALDGVAIVTSAPDAVGALIESAPIDDLQIIDSPRTDAARAHAVEAARAWADTSWRAGLAGLTAFDEAFDPAATAQALSRIGADAALVLGAAWALVDPDLAARIIERHRECPEGNTIAFSQAPPGLAPAVVGRNLVEDLAQGQRDGLVFASIGGALTYIPTRPRQDPIARPACVQIDAALRNTLARFIPDDAQTARELEAALAPSRERLLGLPAEEIARLRREHNDDAPPALPREIILELTTRRPARGDRFWFLHADPPRAPISTDDAARLLEMVARANPDARLTLAGYGDPLEHPACLDVADAARSAGIRFLHLRTDLLCDPATRDRLAAAPIDVLSVDALAHAAETYRRITGVDRYAELCTNLDELLRRRAVAGGMPRPWIVPRITRRDLVYEEIEAFFDKWTLLAGAAAIDQLPDIRFAERIEPLGKPRDVARRDALRRMTILCDGTVIADELDIAGARSRVANVFEDGIEQAWERLTARRLPLLRDGDLEHTHLRTGW